MAIQKNNTTSIVTSENGAQVVLLGAAHVSRASAEEVREHLDGGDYDAVAVELCNSRYLSLTDPDAITRMDLFEVIREGKASIVAAQLALSAYQQRLAEQFDIEPGAEQRQAIAQAEKHGLPVLLIDREIGVTGSRLDLLPRVEWNIGTNWGYMRPSVGYRHTSYDLDWRGQPGDSSPSRGTEILSFDTGLFLERENSGGRTQTLEPRLFYLYVPYEDQSTDPIFDTRLPEFSVSQLFRYNRFTGGDRVGDANQVTMALTSRIIDTDTGQVQIAILIEICHDR